MKKDKNRRNSSQTAYRYDENNSEKIPRAKKTNSGVKSGIWGKGFFAKNILTNQKMKRANTTDWRKTVLIR